MFEDCPMIDINIKIWKFFSFVITKNKIRYTGLVPYLIMNVFQLLSVFRDWNNIEALSNDIFFLALFINSSVRRVLMQLIGTILFSLKAKSSRLELAYCSTKGMNLRIFLLSWTRYTPNYWHVFHGASLLQLQSSLIIFLEIQRCSYIKNNRNEYTKKQEFYVVQLIFWKYHWNVFLLGPVFF